MFLKKAFESLVLSTEFFNRPHDLGRSTTTLLLIDHAFEMLLKAVIVQKGGSIREKLRGETIGFDACVGRGLSNVKLKFLTEEQALVLRAINGLRDAAQHDLLIVSEGQLYVHTQAGLTLFRDIMKAVFDRDLTASMPNRVLPISTTPPTDLVTLFDSEVAEVLKLLRPGRRQSIAAEARLRPLAILDAAIRDEKGQPSPKDLERIGKDLVDGKHWQNIFRGVTTIEFAAEGTGPTFSLRVTKKGDFSTHLVEAGTSDAATMAMKRVNELDFYNLGAKQLAEKVGVTIPKLLAIVDHLAIRQNLDYYKEITIGKVTRKQYSQRALKAIKEELETVTPDEIWHRRKNHNSNTAA